MKRKICVVVGSRANYGSIKMALRAIEQHPDLRLQVVVGASALLDRYGSAVSVLEEDGFEITARLNMLLDGGTPATMVQSTGVGMMQLPVVFEQLRPDFVLTVGDRYETMATALSAVYMNIPLAHTMGGEVSGTIDESVRHAITKLAHVHFPACSDARHRIIRLGESPQFVIQTGCPRIDLVSEVLAAERNALTPDLFAEGVGGSFDLDKPFVMISQHPVTTEYGQGERQMWETIMAAYELGMPCVVFWPNADAGADDVARALRKFRERYDDSNMHFFKNLPPETYTKLMKRTACLVGNSSSAIREGAFIGTPAVNVGTRQQRRQRGRNVIDVDHDRRQIGEAINRQLGHGPYESDPIYGDGRAGERIAEALATVQPVLQKTMAW